MSLEVPNVSAEVMLQHHGYHFLSIPLGTEGGVEISQSDAGWEKSYGKEFSLGIPFGKQY